MCAQNRLKRMIVIMNIALGVGLTSLTMGQKVLAETGYVAMAAPAFRDMAVFDSGGAGDFAGAVVPLAGTTDAPNASTIQTRIVRADTGAVVSDWADTAFADQGTWSGTYPTPIVANTNWLQVEARVKGSAGVARAANRFAAGHVVSMWGQSEIARSYLKSSYDQSTTPVLNAASDNDVQFIHRNVNDDAGDFILQHTFITAAGTATQTAALSAAADTLHALAPGQKFAVVLQTVSGTGLTATVNDNLTDRYFARDKALHDYAFEGQGIGKGALVAMDWWSAPRSAGANYDDQVIAMFFGTDLDGNTLGATPFSHGDATFDHTLKELYGDYARFRVAFFPPNRVDRMAAGMVNSLEDGNGDTITTLLNGERSRRLARGFPDLPFVQSVWLPDLIPAMTFENGFYDSDQGSYEDMLHPNYKGADGLQRYMRTLAHGWVEGLGLRARTEQPVFNNADWDFDNDQVTLWYTDAQGAEVPITTLRNMNAEAWPSATQPHHTEVMGFEFADIADLSNVNGVSFYRARVTAQNAVLSGGRVVVTIPDLTASGLPAANAGSTRILFGGGYGAGVLDEQADRARELWKDYPVIALDRGDGVIGDVGLLPYPEPEDLAPVYNQISALSQWVSDVSNWTTETGTAIAQPDGAGTNRYMMAGGSRISLDLDAVLSVADYGATIQVQFHSANIQRVQVRATTNASDSGGEKGQKATIYNGLTGPHGSVGTPVEVTPFIYRDPNGSAPYHHIFFSTPESAATIDLRDIEVVVTP